MRDKLTTALDVAGAGSISLAGFLVAPALGFLALGVALLAVSFVAARS